MMAFGVANRTSMGRAIRNFYIRWVMYILVLGFVMSGTDNWAHIGGLAGGFVVGYLGGTPVHSSAAREGVWRVLAAVCVLATVVSFFLVYTHFPTAESLR
jgi:rhomboid protease GluP